MITLPIGLVAFFVTLYFSLGDVKLSDYFVVHSIIIVMGGTAAVAATCIPWTVMISLVKNILGLFKPRKSFEKTKADLMKLAANRSSVTQSKDALCQYAIGLWEKGVDPMMFQALLSQYRDLIEGEEKESLASLHALSKYPPALGMLGTVMGMITLFANLGSSDKSGLGPALATAMTATLYGLVLMNGILSPLADRISVEMIHSKKYYNAVYEILTLINRREPSSMIEEEIGHRDEAA